MEEMPEEIDPNTCDRCGPAVLATTKFVLASTLDSLKFCGHCTAKNYDTLAPMCCAILERTPEGWLQLERAR